MARGPLGIAVALGILGGCIDARDRFEDFLGRIPDAAAIDRIDAAPLAQLPDVTGTFLAALSTPAAPDLPTQYLIVATLTDHGDGTGTLATRMQALSVEGRQPVGEETVGQPVLVNVAGEFSVRFPELVTPGEANPVGGIEVTADVTFAGRIRSADRFCGDVPAGTIVKPFHYDLTGSTWSAIRVPDGAVGDALPPPETACPADDTADGGSP